MPRSSDTAIRLALAVIWVLAAIAAGVGVGLMISPGKATQAGEAPVPVASATVVVTSATSATAAGAIPAALPATQPSLSLAPASEIGQAISGSTFTTAGQALYQPANGIEGLQPGFDPFVRAQGNIGTPPAR